MTLQPGTTLGHYEILGSLGAGGMGEVYRAKDPKLDREVAIKVLPEAFAEDKERIARFEREAKSLAALNHPNIATVHGFEQEGDTHFLVMELVEGDNLADLIARGPIEVVEAISLFVVVAEGLEAAHEKGIIHRDLKPANIMVSEDGRVKILDFGLAKAMEPPAAAIDPNLSQSPTMTAAATMRGEIMGTAAYMSPEQALGDTVDVRSDVWAFGVCLFEALTGRPAFEGDTVSGLLASVLKDQPDLDSLPKHTSTAALRRILRQCLAKQRHDRLPHIGAARLDLLDAVLRPETETSDATIAAPVSRSIGLLVAAIAALAAAAGGFAVWKLVPAPAAPRPLVRSSLSAPPSASVEPGFQYNELALSNDGQLVVYRAEDGLYARRLDELGGTPLEGTENGHSPFISPDGAWVGFVEGTALRKVALAGGRPIDIYSVAEGIVVYPRWESDDTIFFAVHLGDRLFRVPASGGEAEIVYERDRETGEGLPSWPQLLPGGETLLLSSFEGLQNEGKIGVLDLRTRQREIVHPQGGRGTYSPSGHLVYSNGSDLLAVPFDASSLRVTGNPVRVIEGVAPSMGKGAHFAVARDGSLAYISADASQRVATLVWVDRQGNETDLGFSRGYIGSPRLSPSGRQAAFSLGLETWTWDLRQGSPTRLTRGSAKDDEERGIYPVWGRSGRELFYSGGPLAQFELYQRSADGSGVSERLTNLTRPPLSRSPYPTSMHPDGSELLFYIGTRPPHSLGVLTLGTREVRLLETGSHDELNGEFSPDGRFLAYQSNESGQWEVYVLPYPAVDTGRFKVSNDGGAEPLWSPNGRELFYRAGDAVMAASQIDLEAFDAGLQEELFRGSFKAAEFTDPRRQYDVHPGGDRFLMVKLSTAPGGESPQVVLVQNWLEELKRLVPVE